MFSKNGNTPEEDAQTGLEFPFVEMFKAQLGKVLSNLCSLALALLQELQRSLPT